MGFEEGLRVTVDWYRRFGEVWWGDISRVLTSFPVVEGNEIWTMEEHDELPSSDEEVGLGEEMGVVRVVGEAVGSEGVGTGTGTVWTKTAWNRLQADGGAE